MVQTGLQTLLDEQPALVRHRRLGVLCHAAAVDSRLVPTPERLAEAGGKLRALFGPEHGVGGDAQYMVGVAAAPRHERLGVPVYSLYGDSAQSLRPRVEWLGDLDALVVDLQDVGSRYYTYVWTMLLALEAGAEAGTQVIVLDRPNPIDGVTLEGPGIEAGFFSFVGMHSIPVRHGLTIAELARLVVAEREIPVELVVVPMRGWQRTMTFEETGLPWVLPSPNMPTVDTARIYPGGCLVEGTNLSEGRGTTRPFEIIGAPWVDGHAWAAAVAAESLPGVRPRALQFCPTFNKHQGQPCQGLQLHVEDRRQLRPMRTMLAAIAAAFRLWPERSAWCTDAYEFVADRPAIDLLAGGTWLREGLAAGATLEDLAAPWAGAQRAFAARRAPFLLYR
jgi:uncharacterized protein YbbC (DUF1343 family)